MAKISKIIKNDLCLGCGLCEAVSNGICKMALTQRGFYEPKMIRDIGTSILAEYAQE